MEKIEGLTIDGLGFTPEYKGDMLYFEGPLISHFVNSENHQEHYFYKLTDRDESCNRWLVFKISVNDLHNYFQKKNTLLELIKKNSFVYLIDYDGNIDPVKFQLCSIKNIPEDYLPLEKSFFDKNRCADYANELKSELLKEKSKEDALELILNEISTIKLAQEKQNKEFKDFLKKVNPTPISERRTPSRPEG